jgi:uncharacterized protein YndB with AHSA1/START domain/DNA-binding transcriptional ArsR family regulator
MQGAITGEVRSTVPGAVFRALADPSRRLLLDRLVDHDGQTLGALCTALPAMTRFGVMKHLDVLGSAGLVTTRRHGREKLHYLNPVPIRLVHDRWISKFQEPFVRAMSRLKSDLEGAPTVPKPRHVHEVYIRAGIEQVWQALTDPAFTSRYFYDCALEVGALAPGSPYRFVQPDGVAALDGEIVEAEPPTRLVMTFHVLFDPDAAAEAPTRVRWELAEVRPGATRLTLVHEDFGGLSRTWSITLAGWRPILDGLKTLLETGEPIGELPDDRAGDHPAAVDVEAEGHRDLGIALHSETWSYLGREDRTPDDDEAMINCAHGSMYHWSKAARRTETNDARGEWLLSHVYAVLGRSAPAIAHAERCLAITERLGLEDFDLAYAHEAMARSLASAGRSEEAARHLAAAHAVPIADDEDRAIVVADLAAGPWFDLVP